jgi:hypothetical protein
VLIIPSVRGEGVERGVGGYYLSFKVVAHSPLGYMHIMFIQNHSLKTLVLLTRGPRLSHNAPSLSLLDRPLGHFTVRVSGLETSEELRPAKFNCGCSKYNYTC